ncbi:hypothetical protein GCM10018787_47750 [Streptomyces thermodiastaticus]|nr:hypothetical protein GCM10018787_47750 [Streptomyces thermodiastaticus]
MPRSRRGTRTEEFITATRAAWGPDPVRHEGEFYRIARSQVNPEPVRARLPVLLAASGPAAVKRAGRIADGVIPIAGSPRALRDVVTTFHDAARKAGRDPRDLAVVGQVPWPTPVTREPIGEGRPFLGGSPRQIAEDLVVARECGATGVRRRRPGARARRGPAGLGRRPVARAARRGDREARRLGVLAS